jgi:integrase
MGLYKKGNTWWFIKQYKGRRVEESLGTSNKKLAGEIYYEEKLPSILNGTFFELPETEPTIPTMNEVIEKYIREVSPVQKSHGRNQEIAGHFYDFFKDCLVSNVKPMISDYKAKRLLGEIVFGKGKGRRAGQSTIRKELSFLRQIFNKAINDWEEHWDGYFKNNPVNPVRKVIKGLKDNPRRRYVHPEEAEKLRFALPAWLKPIVVVGCQTGLRVGNIVNLLVHHCDFKHGCINIPAQEMKDRDPFTIKMTSTVQEILLNVIRSRKVISSYVFADEYGKPYSTKAVSMAFKRACERAGVQDLRFHDLRHDFATCLINKGANLYQVQLNLSHDDPRMAQRYAHLLPENRNVVDKIDGEGTASILLGREKTTTILRQSEDEKRVANAATPGFTGVPNGI